MLVMKSPRLMKTLSLLFFRAAPLGTILQHESLVILIIWPFLALKEYKTVAISHRLNFLSGLWQAVD